MVKKIKAQNIFALFIFLASFVISLVYTLGFLNAVPYAGFRFDDSNGEVLLLFDESQSGVLQIGDLVQEINHFSLEDYRLDPTATLWDGVKPGQIVPLEVLRDGKLTLVYWRYPGYTPAEFNDRFFSQWPIIFIFLAFGVVAYYSVRPRNTLWLLLIAFNLIAALLIAVGSGPSRSHLWLGAYLLHLFAWMLVPVLIHLHWMFPLPFKKVPAWVGKAFIPAMYLFSAVGIVLDLINPTANLYGLPLILSMLVSLILMVVRYFFQKESRKQLRLLGRLSWAAFFPMLLLAILEMADFHFNVRYEAGAILAFPLIAAGYLFAIWQGRVTPVQFRANRVLSIYIYLVVFLMPVTILMVSLLGTEDSTINATVAALMMVVTGLVSILIFGWFQRLVERVILGIPVAMPDLLQSYSQNLTQSEIPTTISTSMGNLILPTLLVRQSALLEMQTQSLSGVLDFRGVEENQIPPSEIVLKLIRSGKPALEPEFTQELPPEYRWVRVALPLTFDQELIGVWLLGARDPDDDYPREVLQVLESIAQQTTFAIINHQKTTRLRALYQANIHRNETERARLARDLHDETLNQIALLQREYKDPQLVENLSGITASLREVIQGLRPEMISYGLGTALDDMADSLNQRNVSTRVESRLEGNLVPLPDHPDIELHLFRIVQQACENAIRHAQATKVTIEGTLSQEAIQIFVTDDGIGFEGAASLNLTALIKKQNYGLAGMHERADLINAAIQIESRPGEGTRVRVNWPAAHQG